jgi:hypothetical protein
VKFSDAINSMPVLQDLQDSAFASELRVGLLVGGDAHGGHGHAETSLLFTTNYAEGNALNDRYQFLAVRIVHDIFTLPKVTSQHVDW